MAGNIQGWQLKDIFFNMIKLTSIKNLNSCVCLMSSFGANGSLLGRATDRAREKQRYTHAGLRRNQLQSRRGQLQLTHDGLRSSHLQLRRGQKHLYLKNAIKCRFMEAEPGAAIAVDITLFGDIKVLADNKPPHLFMAIDHSSGRIVCFDVKPSFSAKDVIDSVTPYLESCASLNKRLILHSDRGPQFTSKEWVRNLPKLFPWIKLSMSDAAKPKQNAVIERAFGILKNYRTWQRAGFEEIPTQFETWAQAKLAFQQLISVQNDRKTAKNFKMGAIDFEDSVLKAVQQGLPLPKSPRSHSLHLLQKANAKTSRRATAIINFQQEAVRHSMFGELGQKPFLQEIPPNANPFEIQLIKENNSLILQAAALKLQLDAAEALRTQQNELIRDEIGDMRQEQAELIGGVNERLDLLFANQEANGKKKVKNYLPLRDALSWEMVQKLVKEAALCRCPKLMRNTLAIIIQHGCGCRVNEIRHLTIGDLKKMLIDGCLIVINYKNKRSGLKHIGNQHRIFINNLLTKIVALCLERGVHLVDRHHIFSDYFNEPNQPLSGDAFPKVVNKVLKVFSEAITPDHNGQRPKLSSHSARIGFVTAMAARGIPIEEISQMVGHKDVKTTKRYDRHSLTATKTMDNLNATFPSCLDDNGA